MAFSCLVCGVGYYGLSLNVVNLSTNLYVSIFLNAIAEIQAYALTTAMLDKFRRAMLVLSRLACLLGS